MRSYTAGIVLCQSGSHGTEPCTDQSIALVFTKDTMTSLSNSLSRELPGIMTYYTAACAPFMLLQHVSLDNVCLFKQRA